MSDYDDANDDGYGNDYNNNYSDNDDYGYEDDDNDDNHEDDDNDADYDDDNNDEAWDFGDSAPIDRYNIRDRFMYEYKVFNKPTNDFDSRISNNNRRSSGGGRREPNPITPLKIIEQGSPELKKYASSSSVKDMQEKNKREAEYRKNTYKREHFKDTPEGVVLLKLKEDDSYIEEARKTTIEAQTEIVKMNVDDSYLDEITNDIKTLFNKDRYPKEDSSPIQITPDDSYLNEQIIDIINTKTR